MRFECYPREDRVLSWVLLSSVHIKSLPTPNPNEGRRLRARYRFDKGTVYSGNWAHLRGHVANFETAPMLEEFLRGPSMLIFEVDGVLGRIDLSGSDTRTAASKYIESCPASMEPSPE